MRTTNYIFASMFFGLAIIALIGVITGARHQAFMAFIAILFGFILLNADKKPSEQ